MMQYELEPPKRNPIKAALMGCLFVMGVISAVLVIIAVVVLGWAAVVSVLAFALKLVAPMFGIHVPW